MWYYLLFYHGKTKKRLRGTHDIAIIQKMIKKKKKKVLRKITKTSCIHETVTELIPNIKKRRKKYGKHRYKNIFRA